MNLCKQMPAELVRERLQVLKQRVWKAIIYSQTTNDEITKYTVIYPLSESFKFLGVRM